MKFLLSGDYMYCNGLRSSWSEVWSVLIDSRTNSLLTTSARAARGPPEAYHENLSETLTGYFWKSTGILQMVLVVIRSGLFDTLEIVCYQNIQLIQCLLPPLYHKPIFELRVTPSTSRTSFYFGSDFYSRSRKF